MLLVITYPFSLKFLLLFFISLFVFVKVHSTHKEQRFFPPILLLCIRTVVVSRSDIMRVVCGMMDLEVNKSLLEIAVLSFYRVFELTVYYIIRTLHVCAEHI